VAAELGMDYENAKLIYRIYVREGRVKQTPVQIKKYAAQLKQDASQLREKVSKNEFTRIMHMWSSVWGHKPNFEESIVKPEPLIGAEEL